MNKTAWRILYGFIFLIAVVFCLRQVHEPDLWWQLRTGEYIIENGTVPATDVFSFSYEGQPWVNVKWGFEVVQAITVKWFGPEFIFLPQIIANLLIVPLLLLTIRSFKPSADSNQFAQIITLLLLLIGLSYRMNGRPEMVSYAFTTAYLFLFHRVHNGQNRLMWLFIPLQLLWANLHEGFGVGIVLLIIFCGSYWFNYFTKKLKSETELKEITRFTGISILAYLSVAIHPMGSTMLGYPYNIFSQLSANQFTSEILSASNVSYWQMPSFINLFFMLLAVVWFAKAGRKNGKFSLAALLNSIPLFYLLIFFAFLYLSFKAYRNVPFFIIVSTPIAAAQLHSFLGSLKEKTAYVIAGGLSIVLYVSIVSNTFYNAFLPMEKYGIGISPERNSVGAAAFIQGHGIAGRPFSDYLGSAYLLWHLQPHFKTFVDLRDLDVFQADDMEIAISCVKYPQRKMQDGRTIWQVVDNLYQFDYAVVLNNPDFVNFHRMLFSSADFEPVYADELNTVYLRKTNQNADHIAQFGFSSKHEVWHDTMELQTSKAGTIISSIFNPFYHSQNRPPSEDQLKKTAYYNYIGLPPN